MAKVPPGVFVEESPVPSIKQPDAITPKLPAPTFKASTGNGFGPHRRQHDDTMQLASFYYNLTQNITPWLVQRFLLQKYTA